MRSAWQLDSFWRGIEVEFALQSAFCIRILIGIAGGLPLWPAVAEMYSVCIFERILHIGGGHPTY